MNKKIYLWFGIVITILISYGIALLAFVLDMKIEDSIKWGEILSDGTTFTSRLSVPVVLAIWSHNKSISDKIELKRKEDREYIQTYVEKHLEPLAYTLDQKEEKNEEKIKFMLKNIRAKSSFLQYNIQNSSFSYMSEYFKFLVRVTHKIIESKHLSMEELEFFYGKLSAHIPAILSLLLLDENQYQEGALSTIQIFIIEEGKIRDITLEVLKDFPEYHEYALKYIEELEQQQQPK